MDNYRLYGNSPYSLAVLHGGPGASGQMKPVTQELSKTYGVIEPLQTKASIAGQMAELKKVLEQDAEIPLTLIGWSWGAWLACLFTAENPHMVKEIILISCPPFEQKYVDSIAKTRLERLNSVEAKEFEGAICELNSGEEERAMKSFKTLAELSYKTDSYNPYDYSEDGALLSPKIFKSVWAQADSMRRNGKLLDTCKRIKCKVTAIHGRHDPHPYESVEQPLIKILDNFEMIILDKCGHCPWLEKEASNSFYEVLKKIIMA